MSPPPASPGGSPASQPGWSTPTIVIAAVGSAIVVIEAAIRLYNVLATSWLLTLVALAVAIVLALFIYRARWSKESELHDPTQRLHLRPTEDGPLLVRTDEVAAVHQLCKSEPAVVLQGDSGSARPR